MTAKEQGENKSSSAKQIEQKISQYMKGAKIGSPKLLALRDVIRERSLYWEMQEINKSMNIEEKQDLLIKQIEYALLSLQIMNRQVGTKGYAKPYDDLSEWVWQLRSEYTKEVYHDGISAHDIQYYLDDTYDLYIYNLVTSLTIKNNNF